MRRALPFIIVAIVGVVTFGSAAMLYRSKRTAPPPQAAKPSVQIKTEEGEKLHIRGEQNAPVTLEEFGDYQCPPCAMVASAVDELERDYRPRLRVVFRHFPLAMHAHAMEAACAAEAAGRQGRYWEMHDLLYREQSIWSKAGDVQTVLNSYAGMLGLNVERFQTDIKSPAVKAAVEKDQREGAARGVKSTPTIFINNTALAPASLNKEGLRAAVDSAIKDSSPKPK
jgi:protein-disulfide isomerase